MFSSYYWPVRTPSISLEGASFYVARLFPVQIRISVARRLVSVSASQVSEMQDSADSHFPKGIDPFLTAKDLWFHSPSSHSIRLSPQDTSYFHFILVCFMYWQNTVLLKVFDKVLLSKLMNEWRTHQNADHGRTRWQRSRWTWSTSLSSDTSGIHLQTQKCMQNTSWERTGVPDQRKRIYRPTKNLVGWRN